jgi:hypothetical protein
VQLHVQLTPLLPTPLLLLLVVVVMMSAWLMQMLTAAPRPLGMRPCKMGILKITCMIMMGVKCRVAAAAVRGSQQQGVQHLAGFKWWLLSSLPVQQQQQKGMMQQLLVAMIMMAGRGMKTMGVAGSSSSSRTGGNHC